MQKRQYENITNQNFTNYRSRVDNMMSKASYRMFRIIIMEILCHKWKEHYPNQGIINLFSCQSRKKTN